jgi:hypothetical protein
MKTAIRTHIAKFSIALWVLTVASVQASITYDYTGNPFTLAGGVYTTSDKITLSVTLSMPLGNSFSGSVTPIAFSFSDGVQTITNLNAIFTQFIFVTGPSGAIENWNTAASKVPGFATLTVNQPGQQVSDATAMPPDSPPPGNFASNGDNPGTWTVAAAAPDGGYSITLLSLPLAVLAIAARWCKRAAA